MQKIRKTGTRGFTLIELVIVIAVIAILAALLVPTILGQAERARLSRAHNDVQELGKAIARMRTDTGNTAGACLTVVANLASGATVATCGSPLGCAAVSPGDACWGGPYMAVPNTDPWNVAFYVSQDTITNAVTVWSNGPNGTSGDSDDITYVQ